MQGGSWYSVSVKAEYAHTKDIVIQIMCCGEISILL